MRSVVLCVRLSWGHMRTARSSRLAQHTGAAEVYSLNVLPCVGHVLGSRDLALNKRHRVSSPCLPPPPPRRSLHSNKRRDCKPADE